jgi:dynein heavy chain
MAKQVLSRAKNKDPKKGYNSEDTQKLLSQYNLIDISITDKLNEAKDNVKYLTTLEKFIEPLQKGDPQQIIETLPALMNAIKMIYTIARYYNSTDKMTKLFIKITNQMIANCKKRIQPSKKDDIWENDPEELIEKLTQCIKLNQAYQTQYNETKEKVADLPKGRHFDFSVTAIFGKFDLFCRRVNKLIEIFQTKLQFKALSKHNFEGVDAILKQFYAIIDAFKKKSYDLLDYNNTKFDRDFVQFNVNISQLDTDLQNFIEANFSKFRNIEYSLKLLRKFEAILIRESLKHSLSSKYNAVLNNYSAELSAIEKDFGEHKQNPAIVRNMPLQAGKIIWAKHLFQKITGPMQSLPATPINPTELRRYYGMYNSLGKQLTIYEIWYLRDWSNNIERAKAGLQSTLIVRHDSTKKLMVNFDFDIFELIREAKCLERVGISIPEGARIILLQEEKFKSYFNELNYLLKEYERIISKIKPICKTILGPHIEDLEFKLRPGLLTLTWTSMNIEAYIKHVHQGLSKLEQLIITVNDIIENRIENNLKAISKVDLVDLPSNSKPLSLDDFVDLQEKHIKDRTQFLMSKNVEVERSVDDLLQTIILYPLDPHVDQVSSDETKRIKSYYIWYLYQALLNSTQNSLNRMKHRVCGKKGQSTVDLRPFFEIDIKLHNSRVVLSPPLEDIQKSINKAATAVLRCSKNLYNWNQQDKPVEQKTSFYEMIAQEKEIVKVILLLTGSI